MAALLWGLGTAELTGNRAAESCDPELARLFAPAHPRLGRYEVCTTTAPLDSLIEAGSTIESQSPLDALGTAGAYQRARVVRLYGAGRPRVAHRWQEHGGGGFESSTLVSPYPDPTLTRLEPGTLIIRFILCCM